MFKDTLSYLRKRAGLTQDELSKALGIARSTLGMYERGLREPDFETLEVIADYFNVNMSTLLGEQENIYPPIDKAGVRDWLINEATKEELLEFIQLAAKELNL